MFVLPLVAALSLVTGRDTLEAHGVPLADTLPARVGVEAPSLGPSLAPSRFSPLGDTVPVRRRSVQYSDGYATRLTIHRYASYAMLPVFAAQFVLGERLITQKEDVFEGRRTDPVDPDLRSTHRAVATGLATLFLVNTTTGLWNLYEARNDPAGRGIRTAHVLTMLAADAGFVAVAILGARATDNAPVDATRHRNVALGSMTLATGGAALMWFFKDR